jgi:hypothetical protein
MIIPDDIPQGIFVVFNKHTGGINGQIQGCLTEYDWDLSSQEWIQIDAPITDMGSKKVDLDTKTVVSVGDLPYTTTGRAVADAKTEYILALPEGTTYEYEVVEDGRLEFTFDVPGPFVIELTNPLYSPLELTINVEAT